MNTIKRLSAIFAVAALIGFLLGYVSKAQSAEMDITRMVKINGRVVPEPVTYTFPFEDGHQVISCKSAKENASFCQKDELERIFTPEEYAKLQGYRNIHKVGKAVSAPAGTNVAVEQVKVLQELILIEVSN